MTRTALSRRHFLQSLSAAAATGMMMGVAGSARGVTPSSYTGKFLINLQLMGAMDVTSFADPKTTANGKIVNNWSTTASIMQAGKIAYAPFAQNQKFFDKYFQDTLIINGIDAQTNSHTVGVMHNWSGRNTEGFPTLTALFAGVKQTNLPMPYLNFGGFSATQGVTSVTQIGKMSVLQNLVEPSVAETSNKIYVPDADWQRIVAMHTANISARSKSASTLEGAKALEAAYVDGFTRSDAIAGFADILPPTSQLQQPRRAGNVNSTLHQQLQVSLLAFKAGMAISSDVFEGGFDTHDDHDNRLSPLLANVTDAIDYLWTYANELGIADRLVLIMGSDFSRTPYYNAAQGKDHWPIGSAMVMQKGASWTNRVAGLTDAGHNAMKINAQTLLADSKGITLKPAHVHKALRKMLGIDTAAATLLFPFNTTEDVAIFG